MTEKKMKKTAIRMPQELWDKVEYFSNQLGISCNAYMVLSIGTKVKMDMKQDELTTPENVAMIFGKMVNNDEQLSLFSEEKK